MSKNISVDKQAVLAELRRRQAHKERSKKRFKFEDYCFPAQIKFFRHEGPRFRTAVCSRRAGKTVGIAADMIDTAKSEKNVRLLYLTLSKRNARSIVWGDLMKIIEDYEIPCKTNQVEMSIKFQNGSFINIEGAKDKTEAEKYRGWKLRKCYIDECQSFRSYIGDLVNEIITPALRDLRGELYLTGTPGPVPAGYFYECSHSPKWHNHKWTAFENPHLHNLPELDTFRPDLDIRDIEVTLAEERELKGITPLDPSYRRETYGEWVEDLDSLVYKYNSKLNDYTILPEADYTYIMGVDVGYVDSDAIAILAYSRNHNKVYLVEEFIKNKMTISELADEIKEIDSHYNCVKKVMDAGALGKKIQEEIAQRHNIMLEAADKHRKVEFIELLNSDMRNGTFKARSNSRFAEDTKLVQWDKEKSTPDRLKISEVYHSDITDAVLYAYREARHFLYEKPKTIHHINSNEFMKQMEEKEAERVEQKLQNKNNLLELDQEELEEYERLMSDNDFFY